MEVEDLKKKVDNELNSLISTRQSLDSILKDLKTFSSVILSLERRISILEKKFEDSVIEDALKEVGMYV